VELRIGIQSVPREIVLDTNDTAEEIEGALRAAVSETAVLVVSDDKGGKVLVPAAKIGYIEIRSGSPRKAGFGLA
jgi:hypothetical protein